MTALLLGLTNMVGNVVTRSMRQRMIPGHLLGRVVRRINADWQARYGHGLEWLAGERRFSGDPMEQALVAMADKNSISQGAKAGQRV